MCRTKRDLAASAAALVFHCPIPLRIATHLYSFGSEDELQASSPTNLHLGEQNSSIFHAKGKDEYVYAHIEEKGWCSEKKQIKLRKEEGRVRGSVNLFDLSLVMHILGKEKSM